VGSIRRRVEKLEHSDGALSCPGCGWPEVTVTLVWPDDPRPHETADDDACCEVCGRAFSIRLVWEESLEDLRPEETNRKGGTNAR
jgi:hypothetical protein